MCFEPAPRPNTRGTADYDAQIAHVPSDRMLLVICGHVIDGTREIGRYPSNKDAATALESAGFQHNADCTWRRSTWLRVRFNANQDDYRPVTFPPPGPYWCSGYGSDHSVIVAYVKTVEQVMEYWPDALNIDVMQRDVPISFSDRFPRPEWWAQ
jgi:hypothetical protein